jgi:predicted amino acid-binding ACT domain protein
MGYRFPGHESQAAIEVYPVTGKKATAAAHDGGLAPAPIPSLIVEGDSRPGLAHDIARALADARINVSFEVGQVLGRRFSAVFGFESEEDAARASALIKRATAGKKTGGKRTSR